MNKLERAMRFMLLTACAWLSVTVANGQSLIGNLDHAGCVFIRGWAADLSRLNKAVKVDIYVDGNFLTTVGADKSRPDVGVFLKDNGLHGFEIASPSKVRDGKSHKVSVRHNGSTKALSNSPVNFTCGPTGVFDSASCTEFDGWAADGRTPNTPVQVEVLEGAKVIASATAGQYRPDLVPIFGNGNHGFSVPRPAALADGKIHTLTVRQKGLTTPLQGSGKQITCAAPPVYDGYIDQLDCTTVRGWAGQTNAATVTVGVELREGTKVWATALANQPRPDLAAIFGPNIDHGFQFPTPDGFRDGAPHDLTGWISGANFQLKHSAGLHLPLTCPPLETSISGKVTTPRGYGVGGVRIRVIASDGSHDTLKTESDGTFTYKSSANKSYWLRLGKFGYNLTPVEQNVAVNSGSVNLAFSAVPVGQFAWLLPGQNIPGDGLDHLQVGASTPLPGISTGCDPADRFVYGGIAVATFEGGKRTGTRICQPTGLYGPTAPGVLCEKTGQGRCFYIDARRGDDNNPGTWDQPWRTTANFVSYYGSAGQPSRYAAPQAGDVFYFMTGVYDRTYLYGATTQALYLVGVQGTPAAPITLKAYPGEHPVLSVNQDNSPPVYILLSKNVTVEGFEVASRFYGGDGVVVRENDGIELRNLWVHDMNGVDNDNISGILVNSANVRMHHLLVHDNYDRINADTAGWRTENSADITTIAGGSNWLTDSVVFQTPPPDSAKTGGCVHEKRSNGTLGTVFEVARNYFINCAMYAVDARTDGMWIHHNFILHGPSPAGGDLLGNRGSIRIGNHGLPPVVTTNIVESNTIVGAPLVGLMLGDYQQVEGPLVVRKNVVTDDGWYNIDRHMVRIGTYDSDQAYNDVVVKGNLQVDQNCYWNSAGKEVRFCLFCDNSDPSRSKGSEVNFTGWQSLGYDAHSWLLNPVLDIYFRPTAAQCQAFGRYAP